MTQPETQATTPPVGDDVEELIDGWLYRVGAMRLLVRHPRHKHGAIYAQLALHNDAGHELYPPTTVNLTSERGRNSIIKDLAERDSGQNWDAIIMRVSADAIRRMREGIPLETISIDPAAERPSPSMLLSPLIYQGLPTVVYGEKATCKSTLALTIYTCLTLPWRDNPLDWQVPRMVRTLYLDYEVDSATATWQMWRLLRGMRLPAIELIYRRGEIPLADWADELHRIIKEQRIDCLIVDSLGPAAGGDLLDAASAIKFGSVLRRLRTASFIIGQTAKNADNPSVFGSTFFQYLSRSVWELRRDPNADDDVADIALIPRYNNLSGRPRPQGIRFVYTHDAITVDSIPITAPELVARLGLKEMIIHCLREGAKSPKTIAEELKQPGNTIRRQLSRMTARGQIVRLQDGSYALPHQPQDTNYLL